jgi:hypothetical protein
VLLLLCPVLYVFSLLKPILRFTIVDLRPTKKKAEGNFLAVILILKKRRREGRMRGDKRSEREIKRQYKRYIERERVREKEK